MESKWSWRVSTFPACSWQSSGLCCHAMTVKSRSCCWSSGKYGRRLSKKGSCSTKWCDAYRKVREGRRGDFNSQADTLRSAGVQCGGSHVVYTLFQLCLDGPGIQCHTPWLQLTRIVKDSHVDPGHRSNLCVCVCTHIHTFMCMLGTLCK